MPMAAPERFDPYRVLRVPRDATPEQLARAYRLQAKRVHPDLHGPDADRQMRDLNRSWQILSDPVRRREWDAAHPGGGSSASHWSGATRPEPAARGRDVRAWADRETARPAAAPGPDRVHVRETWPRPRPEAPAAPSGLRDSGWLAAGVAGVLVIALVVLGWVASTARSAESPREAFGAVGVSPAVQLSLDTGTVLALYRAGEGQLGLASARLGERGWDAEILEERPEGGEVSVRLASDTSGSGWRSVVYGRAPAAIAEVRLSVASTGGEVISGLWVIGVRAPLRPEQVSWRFVAQDGSVVLSGSGELH